jgi:twinkle protein
MGSDFIEGAFVPINKRRLRLDACKLYGYKAAKINDRLVHVAPYRSSGSITAQHIRYVDEKYFAWIGQYMETQMFGQHLWQSGGKRLVIAKGEIDCITIAQAFNLKWPVVAVPGLNQAEKFIKRHLEFVDSFDQIVLAFDETDDGRAAADTVGTMFSVGKVKVMKYNNYHDANEMLLENDGGEVANMVFRAEDYRPDGIVFGDELWEDIVKKPPSGLDLDFPVLNTRLHGIRPERLYMLTAGSGIGKSTLAHEIARMLMKNHNQSVGVMALEESKARLAHRYLGMELNKIIHMSHDSVTEEELKAAYDATINSKKFCLYDHWGSSHIDKLMAKLRYMAVGLGMQWIILDHISIVVSGLDEVHESERKTIDKLMTGMRTLINETGLGMIAIVHLKRKDGKGKTYNEGGKVSITDLRGSGSLEQLSDCIISLERNQQDEDIKNFSQLRLLKDRDLGDTGLCDVLQYHPDTGRLLASDHNPFDMEKQSPFEKKKGGYVENDDF